MKLIARETNLTTSGPVAVMNRNDCLKLGVGENDRIRITGGNTAVSTIIITERYVQEGNIALTSDMISKCSAKLGEEIDVVYSPMPESVKSIRSKINGNVLNQEEIDSIVKDIMDENLSELEILSFVSAFNVNNSTLEEVAHLTRSMASTGSHVDFGVSPIFDFHSLGGVPGNKITPIVVSIVASHGITIPKLSSRAVSSACGTSDYVDTFCDVEMDSDKLRSIVQRCGGVFACGNEDYAPVGRKIIDAERPMGIDPRPTMMASIMSKKVALGITHLLIDIPMGEGSKIPDMETAEGFARDLINLGLLLGIHVKCAVSRADQPIGKMMGPTLEAIECIGILENGGGDPSVVEKACGMAGMILEMAGIPDGYEKAIDTLRSGKAYSKFLEIVEAQDGKPDLRSSDLRPGMFVKDVHAKRDGLVQYVDNACMIAIAKGAGAPADIGAGIELLHKKGDRVKKGEALFRIYANNQTKLDRSVDSARSRRPMYVEDCLVSSDKDMILAKITKESLN